MNALFQLRPQGCPPGIDPADWRRAVAKRIEQHRDAEQALIEALDAIEIDPDLEPDDDDEPSLGANAIGAFDIDRELDYCDDEDGGDDERSIGFDEGEVDIQDEPHNEEDGL